ncbi:LysE family translocator [Aquitalea sp. S1-19]|nr:LysE family translocator [Aquitalea sp. S1-19]
MNFIALVTYLTIMAITPGPNNLALASSGVNFGLKRTLPALMGMALGLSSQVAILALALGSMMALMESIKLWLALAGCLYLFWLSWHMAHAAEPGANGKASKGKPMGFAGGVLFNWLNPKVWLMGFNVAIVFLPDSMPVWQAGSLFFVVTFIITLPCIAVWAWGGEYIRRYLDSPRRLHLFNYSMGGMLACTAAWLLVEMLPAETMAQMSAMV